MGWQDEQNRYKPSSIVEIIANKREWLNTMNRVKGNREDMGRYEEIWGDIVIINK